jgi:hypothetical protein
MCNAPLYDLYSFGKYCSKDCYRALLDEELAEDVELDEDGNVMDEDAIAAQAIDDASWRA